MQLTPGQLQKTVRLSKEAFRHWRQVLPPIQSRKGRSTAFSTGDAIALSIIFTLTEGWGVQVGNLQQISTKLFDLCNATPWVTLESATLLIDLVQNRCELIDASHGNHSDSPVMLCPLATIMRRLRDEFLRTESRPPQQELRLPPTPLKRRANGRRA